MQVSETHVRIFKEAWHNKQIAQLGRPRMEGEKTRAGLDAVFAYIEEHEEGK